MPCHDERDSPQFQAKVNLKTLGIEASDMGAARAAACEMSKVLTPEQLRSLPAWVGKWIERHKKEDAEWEKLGLKKRSLLF